MALTSGAKFKVVPKHSAIIKNNNRHMHSLKTKINVTNDEQNINILTKVIVKRQVTGGRQMRAVLLKVWRIPVRTQ